MRTGRAPEQNRPRGAGPPVCTGDPGHETNREESLDHQSAGGLVHRDRPAGGSRPHRRMPPLRAPAPPPGAGQGVDPTARIRYRTEILIDAPLRTVQKLQTDVQSRPSWQSPVLTSRRLDPCPLRLVVPVDDPGAGDPPQSGHDPRGHLDRPAATAVPVRAVERPGPVGPTSLIAGTHQRSAQGNAKGSQRPPGSLPARSPPQQRFPAGTPTEALPSSFRMRRRRS